MVNKEKYIASIFGWIMFIVGIVVCNGDTIPFAIFLILFGLIINFAIFVLPHIKKIFEINNEIKYENLNNKNLSHLINVGLAEHSLNNLILTISLYSGIPFSKINKDKIKKQLENLNIKINNEVSTKKIMQIIWNVATENNTLKQIKLLELSPNSDERVRLQKIINDYSKTLTTKYNLKFNKEILNTAEEMTCAYLDKFIFNLPTPEQETHTSILIPIIAIIDDLNNEYLLTLGYETLEPIIKSFLHYIFVFEETVLSEKGDINSANFTNAFTEALIQLEKIYSLLSNKN